ncbi:uncharacterized protein N7482_008103 [Penicillium canariense]|uniref:J domain-containing protein n=1 Tax=Penicillium canariense TaxID=189055 RepID=A0A9W9LI94_9EURO|nr:uncharacterized protein N7482_008103 [Penicillium canariense]KAJ5157003.1 hypothetical protein N7482_008103 [Penicillium canariense]
MSTTQFTDHYAILGVARHASTKEINVAWKKFALKHHPDKCSQSDNAIDQFRKGQEAIEVLRDFERRRQHDEELDNNHPSRTGWYQRSSRTSSAYSWKNSRSYPADTSQNWEERKQPCGEDNHRSNLDDTRGSCKKNVQMDTMFEELKPKEKVSLWAETHIREDQPEMDQWDFEAGKGQWEDDYACIDPGARVLRDEEELAAEDDGTVEEHDVKQGSGIEPDGASPGSEASTSVHQSTEYASVASYLHDSSDGNCQLSNGSQFSHRDSSIGSGGMHLPDLETQTDGEDTNFDCAIWALSFSNNGRAISSSNPTSLSTEQFPQEREQPTKYPDIEGSLRPFILYLMAKLNDSSGRYTPDDMYQELIGLVMESVCGWLESTRLSCPNASPLAAMNVSSTCSHLGFWHKRFDMPECENCGLWKPLYILTCPGCGAKKCLIPLCAILFDETVRKEGLGLSDLRESTISNHGVGWDLGLFYQAYVLALQSMS